MLNLGYKRPEDQLPRLLASWCATVSNTTRDILTMKGSALATGAKYLIVGQTGHTVPIYVNPAGTASTSYGSINAYHPIILHTDQVGTAGSTTGCNLFATNAQSVTVLEIA